MTPQNFADLVCSACVAALFAVIGWALWDGLR